MCPRNSDDHQISRQNFFRANFTKFLDQQQGVLGSLSEGVYKELRELDAEEAGGGGAIAEGRNEGRDKFLENVRR
jgi:hypothetical protein